MRKFSGSLFPFKTLFKKLALEGRWWHRLAVVAFSLLLSTFFLLSLGASFESFQPYYQNEPAIRFWVVNQDGTEDDLGTPPDEATSVVPAVSEAKQGSGDIFDQVAHEMKSQTDGYSVQPPPDKQKPALDFKKEASIRASVEMPNGASKEYVGKSKKDIDADWTLALRKAMVRAWSFGFLAALTLTILLSYLLQILYRSLLYVIYGRVSQASTSSS